MFIGAFAVLQIAPIAGLPVTHKSPQRAGTLVATLMLLLVVHRLGWFDAIGINQFGSGRVYWQNRHLQPAR